MVVEDDPVQLDILNHILLQMGYKTILSKNGFECLTSLKTQKPDLLLMDLHMPDMTGFQLLKEIKDNPAFSEIPVLMMSVDSSDESAILCISCGAEGFIHKPIKLHELVLKIKSAINSHISRAEIEKLIKVIRSKDTEITAKYTPEMITLVLGDDDFQQSRAKYTFASILSVRLNGLAGLIHQVDSEKVQEIVDEALTNISKIIYKHRGSVNTIINDLIISTFGLPVVYDKDTVNALLCAEEIKNYEKKLNEFVQTTTGQNITISTGITSGKLYHGVISAMQKINDSLVGDPLIRAIDLEKLPDSEQKFIIIDKETWEVIAEYIKAEDLPQDILDPCFKAHGLSRVTRILHDKIINITNLFKHYSPVDSVSDEGYEKH